MLTGDTLTYTLENANASIRLPLWVTSGQLQTKDPLDYETQTDYEVTVIATDDGAAHGNGSLSDTITVTINVADVSVA